MNGIVIIPVVFLIFYLLFTYKRELGIKDEEKKPPLIDPSAPGVHYYKECDYMGEHKHVDQETTVIDDFKSVRVIDGFDVKAYSTDDVEVLLNSTKGVISAIRCTPFKGMEITYD
mgnify:CR=1 FL=1